MWQVEESSFVAIHERAHSSEKEMAFEMMYPVRNTSVHLGSDAL